MLDCVDEHNSKLIGQRNTQHYWVLDGTNIDFPTPKASSLVSNYFLVRLVGAVYLELYLFTHQKFTFFQMYSFISTELSALSFALEDIRNEFQVHTDWRNAVWPPPVRSQLETLEIPRWLDAWPNHYVFYFPPRDRLTSFIKFLLFLSITDVFDYFLVHASATGKVREKKAKSFFVWIESKFSEPSRKPVPWKQRKMQSENIQFIPFAFKAVFWFMTTHGTGGKAIVFQFTVLISDITFVLRCSETLLRDSIYPRIAQLTLLCKNE